LSGLTRLAGRLPGAGHLASPVLEGRPGPRHVALHLSVTIRAPDRLGRISQGVTCGIPVLLRAGPRGPLERVGGFGQRLPGLGL
jgi:hypothetical protein